MVRHTTYLYAFFKDHPLTLIYKPTKLDTIKYIFAAGPKSWFEDIVPKMYKFKKTTHAKHASVPAPKDQVIISQLHAKF